MADRDRAFAEATDVLLRRVHWESFDVHGNVSSDLRTRGCSLTVPHPKPQTLSDAEVVEANRVRLRKFMGFAMHTWAREWAAMMAPRFFELFELAKANPQRINEPIDWTEQHFAAELDGEIKNRWPFLVIRKALDWNADADFLLSEALQSNDVAAIKAFWIWSDRPEWLKDAIPNVPKFRKELAKMFRAAALDQIGILREKATVKLAMWPQEPQLPLEVAGVTGRADGHPNATQNGSNVSNGSRPRGAGLAYRSEQKRAILVALTQMPDATDLQICDRLDEDGSCELPAKAANDERSWRTAYLRGGEIRHSIESTISKVRVDMRRLGL